MDRVCALLAAALVIFSPTAAIGVETIVKTIPADEKSYLYGMATYNKLRCRGSASPTLGRWSAGHGTITTEKVKQVVAEGKKCAGNTFYYLVVYYTPMPGFRGKDLVTFSILAPKFEGSLQTTKWQHRADLTVK